MVAVFALTSRYDERQPAHDGRRAAGDGRRDNNGNAQDKRR
jgi:hypothetical protein